MYTRLGLCVYTQPEYCGRAGHGRNSSLSRPPNNGIFDWLNQRTGAPDIRFPRSSISVGVGPAGFPTAGPATRAADIAATVRSVSTGPAGRIGGARQGMGTVG